MEKFKRNPRARIMLGTAVAAAAATCLMGWPPTAQAASQSWSGGSVSDGNWSDTSNWLGGAAPGATTGTTNTDIATFNAAIANTWGLTGTPIVIDSTTQNIDGISFDTATGNYFIGATAGHSLLLTSGGTIQILGTLTATNAVETINAPLVLEGANGTYTFSNNSANGAGAGAGTLDFAGGITGGAAGATVLTLGGTNTNANTLSGIIANGTATTLAITKTGAGLWVLSGVNTYTGPTTITAGTLQIGGAGQLGGGTYAGAISNAGTLQYNSSATQTLSGVISGAGGLTVSGSGGNLTLSNAGNTFTGNVLVSSGTLTLSTGSGGTDNALGPNTTGRTITIGSGATLVTTATDVIDYQSTTVNNLAITIAGTWNNNPAGATLGFNRTDNLTLQGATINDQGDHPGTGTYGGILMSGTVTVSGTAASIYNQISPGVGLGIGVAGGVSGQPTTFNVADVTGNANPDFTVNGILRNTPVGTGGFTKTGLGTMLLIAGTSAYSGTATISAGTLQLGDGTTGHDAMLPNGTLVDNAALVINNFAAQTYSGETLSGTGSLAKNGAGQLTFDSSSNLSYGGTTTVNGGILRIDYAAHLTGQVAVNNGATLTLTDFAGSLGSSDLNTPEIDLTGGTINGLNASHQTVYGIYTDVINVHGTGLTSTIGGSYAPPIWINVAGDSNPHTLTITVDSGAIASITSVIGNHPTATGAGSLTKAGAGTLTLGGANTYTGGTTLNVGQLTLANATALGTGTLTLNAGTLSLGNLTIANNLSAPSSTVSSIVYNSAAGGTLSGSLTGSGTVNFSFTAATSGSNIPVLPNFSTFTGTIGIDTSSAFIFPEIHQASGAPSALLNVTGGTNGGTTGSFLFVDAAGTVAVGALSGNGILGGSSSTTWQVGGLNTNTTFSGILENNAFSGTTSLAKVGTATLTLSGANTYTGSTTVTAGTLLYTGGSLAAGAQLIVGGTSATSAIMTLASGVGTLTFSGAGGPYTAIVGANGGSGTLNVNAGTLSVGGSTDGDLTLATGTNATGVVNVAGGTLTLGGTNGRLIIADGSAAAATVNLNSGAINAVSVIFAGGTGTSAGETGTFNLNGGTLTTGSISRFNSQGTYNFNFNGGTLSPTGDQSNFLQANNVYNVQSGGAFFNTAGHAITVSQPLVAAAANGGLTKNGAGTLTLAANSTGSAMNLTVNTGTLKLAVGGLAFNNPGGIGNGGTVTVNSGSTLELNQAYNVGYAQPLVINGGTVNVTAGSSTDGQNYLENLQFTGGGSITGFAMRLGDTIGTGGTVTVSGSAAATISSNIAMIGATGKTATFNVGATGTGGADLTISGAIQDFSVAGLPLIKTGAGTLLFTGANAYSGATTISAGTLMIGGAGVLGGTSYAGAISNSGTLFFDSSATQTLSGIISGAGMLTQAGSGNLILSNSANSFTGNILVSSGTLSLSGGGNATNSTVGANTVGKTVTIASGATLTTTVSDTIDFSSATVNNLAFTLAGNWNNNPANTAGTGFQRTDNLTLQGTTINDSGQNGGTYGGIMMSGTVTVSGSAASTYNQTGNGSGLAIGDTGGVSGQPTTFNVGVTGASGGDFIVNGLLRNAPPGTGGFTKTGLGTMVLAAGTSTYSGTTTISAGVLQIGNAGTGGTLGVGDVTDNASLVFNRTDTYGGTVSNIISGTGTLTQAGTGTLTLSGANTYSGATAINGGTLGLTGSSGGTAVLGNTAVTVGDGSTKNGVLLISSNVTVGSGTGSITVKGGSGTNTGQGTLSLADGATNTLTINDGSGTALTLGGSGSNSSLLNFEYNPSINTVDKIALGTGTLNLNAGGATINLTEIGTGTLASGTYALLTFASGSTFTGGFTLAGGPIISAGFGRSYSLSTVTGTSTSLNLLVSGNPAPADAYWAGTTDNSWSTISVGSLTNWRTTATGTTDTNQIPGPGPGGGTNVHFYNNSATAFSTVLGQNFTIGSLAFDNNSNAITIDGSSNTLTLIAGAGTGISMATTAGNDTLTANVAVALAASQTWTNGTSANTLTVNGGISNAAGTSGTQTLTLSAGQINLGGIIANGAGTLALTVSGGTTTLTGANTYTGATSISAGILKIGGSGVLGGGSYAGAISDNGTLVYNSSAAQTLSGVISGTGGLTVSGSGNLTLSNVANSFSGNILLSAGTLTLSGGGSAASSTVGANTVGKTITIASGATLTTTVTDTIDFNSTTVNNLAFTLAGTWNNNPANTGSTGFQRTDNLTLQGATINDSGQHPGGFGGILMSGTVNISGSATSTYNQTGAGSGLAIGDTGGISGQPTTFNVALTGASGGDFIVNGLLRNASSGTGGFTKTGLGTMVLTAGTSTYSGTTTISAGVLQIGNAGTGGTLGVGGVTDNASLVFNRTDTYGGPVSNIISGTGTLTQAGTGTLTLSGANSYAGATAVNAGTLQAGSTNTFSDTSAVTLANTAGVVLDLNNNSNSIGSLTGGGTTGGNVTLGSGTLTIGGDNTSSAAYAGVISGTGGIAKGGTGTLGLSAVETYTGATAINGGTLSLTGTLGGGTSGGTAISVSDTLTESTSGVIAGTSSLGMGGNTVTLNGVNTYTGATTLTSGTLNLNGTIGGGVTGTAVSSSGTFTEGSSGVIAGTSSLSVTGGTTALGGTNTYTGATGVSGSGTLSLTGTIGSAGGTAVTSAGTLNESSTGNIAGTSSLSVTGGVTTLLGANGYSGSTTIGSSGSLVLGDGTSGHDGTVASSGIADGGALAFNYFGNHSYGNVISGTGSLTKSGAGVLTLSGANTYTGTTTLAGGVLNAGVADVVGTSGALGKGGTVTFTGGTLQYSSASAASDYSGRFAGSSGAIAIDTNGQSVTFASSLLGSNTGGLTLSNSTGSGVLTLAASAGNAYVGATAVNGGTLVVNNTANSGTGSGTVTVGGSAASGSPTLTGTGILSGLVTISAANGGVAGTINPGTVGGVGTLRFGGGLTLGSGATFAADVSGATADELSVTGNATITGTLSFTTGLAPTASSYILLLATGSVSGSFSNILNVPTGYRVVTRPNQIDLLANSAIPPVAYWSGAQSTIWNTANNPTTTYDTNWLDGPAGNTTTLPGSTTDVYETANSATNLTQTLGQNFAINSLNFTSGAGAVTLNADGSTLTIKAGITNLSNNTQTINVPVILSGDQSFTNGGSGSLAIAGGVSGTGNLTLANNSSFGGITFSGSALNNTGAITNSGTGGSVQIQGGIGGNVTAITQSATSALSINTNALAVSANTTVTDSLGAAPLGITGGVNGTGNLTLNNNSTANGGITLATTAINNTGTLTNSGTGTGQTTIAASIGGSVTGIVQNSATSALNLLGSNASTGGVTILNGTVIQNGSATALGGGTLLLGDPTAANTHSATLLAVGGGFTAANAITVQSGSSAALTISAADAGAYTYSGLVTLGNNLTLSNTSSGSLTLSGGVTGAGNLILNNNSTTSHGITLSTGSVNPAGIITNSGTGSGSTLISSVIGTSVTGVTQNSATSSLVLSGTNTYTGLTTLAAGVLKLGSSGALGGNGNVTFTGGTLQYSSSNQSDVSASIVNSTGPISIDTNAQNVTFASVLASSNTAGLTKLGSGTLTLTQNEAYTSGTTISGGTLQVGIGGTAGSVAGAITNNGNLVFFRNDTTPTTVSGFITDNQSISNTVSYNGPAVAANGQGQYLVTAGNTYGGSTTINNATVAVGTNNASAFGVGAVTVNSGGQIALGSGASLGNSLTLNGLGWTDGSGNTAGALQMNNASASGPITLGSDTRITAAAGSTNIISGVISGGHNLEFGAPTNSATAGTLTLNGTSTYTGTTTVSNGSLTLGASGNLGATAVTVSSGATLNVAQTANAQSNTGGATLNIAGGSVSMADGFTTTLSFTGSGASVLAPATGTAPAFTFDVGSTNVGSMITTATDEITFAGAASFGATGSLGVINLVGVGSNNLVSGNYPLILGGASSTLATNAPTLASSTVLVNGSLYSVSLIDTGGAITLHVGAVVGFGTLYWHGDVSSVWSDQPGGAGANTNWTSDSAGLHNAQTLPTAITNVDFSASGATNLTTTLGGSLTIKSLNFLAGSASATINDDGHSILTITNGVTNASSNPQALNAQIVLGLAQSFTNNGAGTLTVGGAVDNGGNLLTIAGTGTTVLSGTITGTGGLTIGNGTTATTAVLNGPISSNLYGGNTTIMANATLGVGSNFQIPDGGSAGILVDNGMLALNGHEADVNALSGSGVVDGVSGSATLVIGGGGLNSSFGGILRNTAGALSVNQAGSGTLTLSGANTFSGALNVTRGTVIGTSPGAFGDGTGTINLGTNDSSNPTATLLVGITGQTYANPINLVSGTAGTLSIGSTGNIPAITFSGPVTNTGSSQNLTIDNVHSGAGTDTITFSGLINNSGAITAFGQSNGNTAGAMLTVFSGGVGSNVTSILNDNGTPGANASLTLSGPIALLNSAPGTLITEGANSIGKLTVSGGVTGSGVLVLNNIGTVVGGITFTTLPINFAGPIYNGGTFATGTPNSGSVIISGGIGSNVTQIIQFSGSSPLLIQTAPLAVNSAGTTLGNAGGTAFTVTGGVTGTGNLLLDNEGMDSTGMTISGAAVNNIGLVSTVNQGGTAAPTLISSVIGANVTGVTQNNASQLILNGVNLYTGPTTISNGMLVAGSSQALGLNSAVSLDNSNATTLSLIDGNSVSHNTTIGSLTGGAGGGTVALGTARLTIGTDNTSPAPFAGAITGTGGVTKTGTGSLILSGSNTYTGTTMVTGGTLSVTGALGNTTVTVASGSTLAGNGTIGGSTEIMAGATLAPSAGQSTAINGHLALTGGLKLDPAIIGLGATPASTLLVKLDTSATGVGGAHYDNITFGDGSNNATATLTGATLVVDDRNYVADHPQITIGDQFWILTGIGTNNSISGEFNTNATSIQGIDTGATYSIQYNAPGSPLAAEDPYGSGGDVLLTVTTVPEPTSLSLLALSAAGLLARRRRRTASVGSGGNGYPDRVLFAASPLMNANRF